ncbi:hypothetical protein [Pyrococcus sp. NA2]|uniref:hypothetical protein n=1 Tax=Pyrococcus sp. (strain NA2) TaxID=342949 RepID=UPI000A582DC6|nr:hypothetical protein [Pyrococcus sp. NA2]
MTSATLKKNLFKKITELIPEIKEEFNYGVPHLVGEIAGEETDIQVVVYKNKKLQLIINDDNGWTGFIMPIEDPDVKLHKLLIKLQSIIEGKNTLKPGMIIKEPLKLNLRKLGYTVVWMSSLHDIIEVIAVRAGEKYRISFRVDSPGEFRLVEVNKI